MNVMNLIQNNYEEAIAMILFGIGFPKAVPSHERI